MRRSSAISCRGRLALVHQRADAGGEFLGARAEQTGGFGQGGSFGGDMPLRGGAGQRLDAAHAAGRGALADEAERADLTGAADMGAAAELERIGVAGGADAAAGTSANGDDADLVAVFLAEERAGARAPLRRQGS